MCQAHDDADDTDTLHWKLNVLDLALAGLLAAPHPVARQDLLALQGLVHELVDLSIEGGR